MKSRGYCTSNKDGVFEFSYTLEESLFSKLFKLKREFRYTCADLNKDNFRDYLHSYDVFDWYDEDGKKVKNTKKLSWLLTEAIVVDDYLHKHYSTPLGESKWW